MPYFSASYVTSQCHWNHRRKSTMSNSPLLFNCVIWHHVNYDIQGVDLIVGNINAYCWHSFSAYPKSCGSSKFWMSKFCTGRINLTLYLDRGRDKERVEENWKEDDQNILKISTFQELSPLLSSPLPLCASIPNTPHT